MTCRDRTGWALAFALVVGPVAFVKLSAQGKPPSGEKPRPAPISPAAEKVAHTVIALTSKSALQIPASSEFPPDAHRWFPLNVPSSESYMAFFDRCPPDSPLDRNPDGTCESLGRRVELRGWLRFVSHGCNKDDPDWHYNFEPDVEFLDANGIEPRALLSVGSLLAHRLGVADEDKAPVASVSGVPLVHVELNGWRR